VAQWFSLNAVVAIDQYIEEHLAEDVSLSSYRAACERWPGTRITLRQGARVIEDSRRLRVVSSQ
jgi:hypothetical protein